MDITTSGFNNEQPDGYQVIDPKTQDVLGYPEETILTYALAKHLHLKHLEQGALIIAVTEEEVNSRLGQYNEAGYAPDLLMFSGAIYRKEEPILSDVQIPTVGGELCLTPNIVNSIISAVGLPVPLDPKQAQYRWPLEDASEWVHELLEVGIPEGPLRDAIVELQKLIITLHYEEADFLTLDYGGLLA